MAVVDCEDVAGAEGLGKGAGEGVDAQVYFCCIGLLANVMLRSVEALGEEGGGGFVDDLGQGVVFDANVDFLRSSPSRIVTRWTGMASKYSLDRMQPMIFRMGREWEMTGWAPGSGMGGSYGR